MSGAMIGGERGLVFRARLDLGRRIAGAALAVIGAAIALQLVRAIVANRASTHADWRAYLPVVLVFGTVALAFLLPGTLILLYRREVRVDPENRRSWSGRRISGLAGCAPMRLSSFKKIVLARRMVTRRRSGRSVGSSHARRSYPFFVVELARPAARRSGS
jgi:hypothetical protein